MYQKTGDMVEKSANARAFRVTEPAQPATISVPGLRIQPEFLSRTASFPARKADDTVIPLRNPALRLKSAAAATTRRPSLRSQEAFPKRSSSIRFARLGLVLGLLATAAVLLLPWSSLPGRGTLVLLLGGGGDPPSAPTTNSSRDGESSFPMGEHKHQQRHKSSGVKARELFLRRRRRVDAEAADGRKEGVSPSPLPICCLVVVVAVLLMFGRIQALVATALLEVQKLGRQRSCHCFSFRVFFIFVWKRVSKLTLYGTVCILTRSSSYEYVLYEYSYW